MTDPKPRSAFLPIMLLIVALVICAGVVVAFVPLVECDPCYGLGSVSLDDLQAYEDSTGSGGEGVPRYREGWSCRFCSGSGRVTLRAVWLNEIPEREPAVAEEAEFYKRRKARSSYP